MAIKSITQTYGLTSKGGQLVRINHNDLRGRLGNNSHFQFLDGNTKIFNAFNISTANQFVCRNDHDGTEIGINSIISQGSTHITFQLAKIPDTTVSIFYKNDLAYKWKKVTPIGSQATINNSNQEIIIATNTQYNDRNTTGLYTSYSTATKNDFQVVGWNTGNVYTIDSFSYQSISEIIIKLTTVPTENVTVKLIADNSISWWNLTPTIDEVLINSKVQSIHKNPETIEVNSATNIAFDRIKKSSVDVIGMTDEDTTTMNYSSNNQITDNDTLKSVAEKLDTKIGADANITAENYVIATDDIESQINELDINLKTTNDNIGNRNYTYNEIVTDNETVTASIEAIATYIHNEDYVEKRGYDAFQAITKQSGVSVYTITQDENCTTPYTITDGTLIVNNLTYFSIRTADNKPVYKQGFNFKLSGDVVKVISYNPATREITLNYEPSTDFVVEFLYKYANVDVPNGKLILGSNIQNIVDNTPTNIAESINYTNATSELVATNVQSAIDEIDSKIDTLNGDVNTSGSILKSINDNAENATYTNTTSNLSATTLKTAVDELTNLTKYNSFGVEVLPTLTKEPDGRVTIGSDGTYVFNSQVDGKGLMKRFENVTGTTLTIPDNTVSYIYVDYNNGSPIFASVTSPVVFLSNATYIPIVRVTRESSTTLHFEEYDQYAVQLSNKLLYKDIALHAFERQTGLILSTTPTRIITLSAGFAWFGVESFTLAENKSGTSGSLYEYYLTSGVWGRSLVTSYDSSYYSDGTNRLALQNNKWVAKYFWRDIGDDNEVYYVHGNQYNSQSEALAEAVPIVPSTLTSHSLYVGKIVIQYNATNGIAYPRAWDTAIQSATATNHNDLANIQGGTLNEYYHNTLTQANALTGLETPIQPLFSDEGLNGIPDAEKSKWGLSYNAGTRVFTLTITGSNTYYYVNGKKFILAVGTYNFTAHTNTTGTYYFYFNNLGQQISTNVAWDILTTCPIAYVYYNATQVAGQIGYELHGCNMSSWSHLYHHTTDGTKFGTGGALTGYTIQSDTLPNVKFGVDSATYYDEDIALVSDTFVDGSNYNIMTRNSSGEWSWSTATTPYLNTLGGTNNPRYNQNGTSITEITSNNTYFNYYLVLTNFTPSSNRVWLISGQQTYTSLASAQGESVANLNLGGLPFQEFVILWQITYRYSTSYSTTTAKTRIEAQPVRVTTNRATISGFAGSHNALSGRTDVNSHPISAINGTIANAVIFEKSDGTGLGESSDITWNDSTKVLTLNGDINVKNIIQDGISYETHLEQLYTEKDQIILRDKAVSALSNGVYAGLRFKKYDGVNDGLLVVGNDGVARVGDVDSTQAVATREDAPVNGKVPIWNSTTLKFETASSPTTVAGYGITDGVTLSGTETLNNKTMNSPTIINPIINGTPIGTAITTTGEADKLVKTSSLGNISMTQSVDGNVGVVLNNTSSGVNSNAGFSAKGNTINYLSAWCYGSGRTGTIFGRTMANHSVLLVQGADNAGLLLGTLGASPLVIGTNGVERYNINSNGIHTFTTPATTSYNAIFRNTSYATTDTSGNSSLKIGYANHDGVKIEAYKETINVSGIKFYGEYGFGVEKLLLNLKTSDSSANFSGIVQVNTGSGNNIILGTNNGAGLLSIKDSSSVENIRLDGSATRVKIGNATTTELNPTTAGTCRTISYGSLGVIDNSDNKAVWISVDSGIDNRNMLNFRRANADTIYRAGVRSDGSALVFGDSGIERLVIHKLKYIEYIEQASDAKLYIGRLNGTYSSPTAVLSGDTVASIVSRGQVGTTAYNYVNSGSIRFVATGNYVNSSNAPTDLVISLATTSSEATEKLRLTSAGNLKLSSLAGTGNRMVVADSAGNLSASGVISVGSTGTVNFTTNEIKVKPTTTLSLVAGTWYNVCESSASQPDDVIMVNLACYISSGNNHSALIAVTKAAGFYGTATTIASQSSGLIPTYTFRFNAGYLQIAFNATNLPANFNTHTIARFS